MAEWWTATGWEDQKADNGGGQNWWESAGEQEQTSWGAAPAQDSSAAWKDPSDGGAAETQPPPPNGGGSWGWGNDDKAGADAGAPPVPNGAYFWECQDYNKQNGTLSRKEEWEVERDDVELFKERLGSNAGLDFQKYDKVPVDVSGSKAEKIPVVQTFSELYDMFSDCIPPALVENVKRCQYERPTPVQKFAIPVGLVGRDIMCCAQTGSGKTAAFLFPVIGRMMHAHETPIGALETPFEGPCTPDTLVLSPTRELCIQIYEEALKFCHRTPYRVCRVYGGEKPKDQMDAIAKGADVMIATPGRLQDFLNRGIVKVSSTYVLVLDEADRMLDMGFEPQIRDICENNGMPSKDSRQTLMFSATFPESCQRMAQDFLYNYIWIGVGVVGGAVDTVEQRLEKVTPSEKYDKLFEVLDNFMANRAEKERCLVFVNAKDTAKWLDEQLYAKKIATGALHGNLTQPEREKNLRLFRDGEIDVMIATDVASRGLDIEKVSVVVNYDMPNDIDSYVHRIGRTGRIGNKGVAITFIATEEWGGACENADVLKELLRIMSDVGSSIPEWLTPLVEGNGQSGNWSKWGDKDAREEWGSEGWSNWKTTSDTKSGW